MPKATHNLSLGEGNYFSGKRPANTKNHSSKSPSLEPRLERTGRFIRSSRKNPCPICDRSKDDKCAWNSEVIHCYNGSSNYPPQNLKLGEVVELDIPWALVKKNAGFSGNHWIFIPDKPIGNAKPLIKKHIPKVSIPRLNKLFNVVYDNVQEALKPELSFLNLQQLEAVSVKTTEALAETKTILAMSKQFSQQQLINDIQLTNLFECTKTYYRQLSNRAEQIKQFRVDFLGEMEVRDDHI
tara:strand:+ start:735 stop:1454 length:720 start_codon:yes stop_codon:yes gene_type:complete